MSLWSSRVWCLGSLWSDGGVWRWISCLWVECRGPWPVSQPDCKFTAELLVAVLKMTSLTPSPLSGRSWGCHECCLPNISNFPIFSPRLGLYFISCFKVRCGHETCCGPSKPPWLDGTNKKSGFVISHWHLGFACYFGITDVPRLTHLMDAYKTHEMGDAAWVCSLSSCQGLV